MKNKHNNWFWGIFFIIASAAIIVNQLGYFTQINLLSLILTILLIPIILKSIIHVNFAGILFPIAILAILFAEPLHITNLVPWPILLTALLGSIGLSLLFKKSWPHRVINGHFDNHNFHHEHFEQVVNNPDDSNVDFKVSFGSGVKYVNSESLKRVNLSCSFGALKVFFENSKISTDGAEIYLDASFSGIELYIPKTWNIINNANVSLAGVEEKNHRQEPTGPQIILKGNISFSGVEIVYV